MKLYFAVFVVVLSSFCIAETLSYEIDDEEHEEIIQTLKEVMEEIDEEIGKEKFENSEEKREFRMDKESIKEFATKVKDLLKSSKNCWNEIKDKVKALK
uniref:Zodarin 5a n=1 Tax=Zodarion styliferum TaxID=1089303 RepID=A0A8D7ZS71_9ARAC|nr:Zodarin 5a precursor [Zodarion styliferum]